MDEQYVTKTGRVLTDADLDKLAAEAEAGYDIERLKKGLMVTCPTCRNFTTNRPARLAEHYRRCPVDKPPTDE